MRACLALIELERVFVERPDMSGERAQHTQRNANGTRRAAAARLAAVQALYQMDMAGTDLNA